MVQLTPHKWQIESQNGAVIQTDITAHGQDEAKEYAKRYISSFSDWDFKIIPLIIENNTKVPKN